MDESKPKDAARRDLIKCAGMGVAAIAVMNAGGKAAAAITDVVATATAGEKFAMVVDLKRCVGCHACAVSCKAEFDVPLGNSKSKVKAAEIGNYPNVKRSFLPSLCNQCESPPCVPVCPTGASHIRDNGIVAITEKDCIGCGRCVVACPYKARYMHPASNIAQKCDFCKHRVENGIEPSCVNTCPSDARIFGDLNDPNSEVSKLISKVSVLSLKPELGTKPKVYYKEADKIDLKNMGKDGLNEK